MCGGRALQVGSGPMQVNVLAVTDHLKAHGQRCSLVSLDWLRDCQRCGALALRLHGQDKDLESPPARGLP